MIDLKEALRHIDPVELSYEEWLEIGMGLKAAADEGCDVSWHDWDQWSAKDAKRYKSGECQLKWNSFNSSGITKGTVVWRAMEGGFNPLSGSAELSWDDEVGYDGQTNRDRDFPRFLKALFKPGDLVSYCLDVTEDEGKWRPASTGVLGLKVSELLSRLETGEIEDAIGDYNRRAGGWIRFNPMDGNGVKSENVTDYRYTLIESDGMPVEEQLRLIYKLRLPCAAIVDSGGRSIHAVVKVGAGTLDEYKSRVSWLHRTLKDNGFSVDESNKNPNRMCRLPGLWRGGCKQRLIDTNTGYGGFAEWKEYVENGLKDLTLPGIEPLSGVWENMPSLAPELIHGVLRQGHKMLLAAPSKAGKSFALIELCVDIAEGWDWLGFQCSKGKVLYINLEIDRASFFQRIKNVYDAMGRKPQSLENIDVWNLRGKALPMHKFADKIIKRVKDQGYVAIILDPIYKVQSGDENSAGDIARFTNDIDHVTNELNVSMIYCHHHSKGNQGFKRSVDRASGSGVFGRDPDAILDLIELDNDSFRNLEGYQGLSAWRMEGTLREFPPFAPVNMFFEFPLHKVDRAGILDNAEPRSDFGKPNEKRTEREDAEQFDEVFKMLQEDNEPEVREKDILNYYGIKTNTLRSKLSVINGLENRPWKYKRGDKMVRRYRKRQ